MPYFHSFLSYFFIFNERVKVLNALSLPRALFGVLACSEMLDL